MSKYMCTVGSSYLRDDAFMLVICVTCALLPKHAQGCHLYIGQGSEHLIKTEGVQEVQCLISNPYEFASAEVR